MFGALISLWTTFRLCPPTALLLLITLPTGWVPTSSICILVVCRRCLVHCVNLYSQTLIKTKHSKLLVVVMRGTTKYGGSSVRLIVQQLIPM